MTIFRTLLMLIYLSFRILSANDTAYFWFDRLTILFRGRNRRKCDIRKSPGVVPDVLRNRGKLRESSGRMKWKPSRERAS